MNSPCFRWVRSRRVGPASVGSERHAACARGPGTFGLSGGLITSKGKAVRVGSVITDLSLKPSAKKYAHPLANCLYFYDKTCKACADRCPAGVIIEKGQDKAECFDYCFSTIHPLKQPEYGVKVTGCGLCQAQVPWSSGWIPGFSPWESLHHHLSMFSIFISTSSNLLIPLARV